MKKLLLFTCLFSLTTLLNAQDYFTGKIKDKTGEKQVFYDRTQYAISANVFQSIYKVMDGKKQAIYSITLTHDRDKAMFFVAVKKEGLKSKGTTITYDPDYFGLIFNNISNFDTSFLQKDYNYLLSFTDTSFSYPVLHKIKVEGISSIDLDPLTALRIKKHVALIKGIPREIIRSEKRAANALSSVSKDWMDDKASNNQVINPIFNYPLNQHIFELRDQFYIDQTAYTEGVADMRKEVEENLKLSFKSSQLSKENKHFVGAKNGKGILIENGNGYDGIFKGGKLVSGKAIIHTKSSEYYGEMSNDSMNGTGWITYENGSYSLGIFSNGKLTEGVVLWKEKSGETFFGNIKNGQRTGYGELRNGTANVYYGEFLNGHLVSGYAKEVDPFGYASYSRIEDGTKSAVEPQLALSFFDALLNFKREQATSSGY